MYNTSSAEVLERGIGCLLNQLGALETERFISVVIRERFDYTKWRREFFDGMSVQEINEEAVSYAHEHPFTPTRAQIKI